MHHRAVFRGSVHAVVIYMLLQKTTKGCRFYFKLERHNI